MAAQSKGHPERAEKAKDLEEKAQARPLHRSLTGLRASPIWVMTSPLIRPIFLENTK